MKNDSLLKYRMLNAEEVNREIFTDFIRYQNVTKCWRKENGKWIIKDAPFIDDWTERDYQKLIFCLKNTIASNGFVAVDGTKSEPEVPASVTCIPMSFTRWSLKNSRYTCQPHIMGEYNKLEFIAIFHS